ncbi:MAG: hypothetical protein BECKG1743E_GA0114224_111831 [Candidatus Kentron sp. G]|nr:MAG: hypothetical protein BECKG1743E_GA0114224_111831 [Candidatus Kentron sp. G]
MSFAGLVCCNDSYIVRYAPVCARSRTNVLYDPGFAIRVNYFLWGTLLLRPSKFEGHCPMIRHGCRMALMVALNWSVECVKEES